MELRPTPELFECAKQMFEDLWEHRLAQGEARAKHLAKELAKTESEVEQFLDRVVNAATPSLVSLYEERIRKLEKKKAEISEKIENCGRPVRTRDDSLATALEFLGNPHKLYTSDRLEDKHSVIRLCFTDKLVYSREKSFRTPPLAVPFQVLGSITKSSKEVARPERFELPTSGFVGRRSIQLNYGRAVCPAEPARPRILTHC